ncbi:MAG: hypothetical protein IPN02_10175 [Candidatus Microthrix sp.]|uniref:Uncharacterized protein n=1 Tax=Candidatus Neomicrothrix subdominans TaxID=2954438 RepID=A0A936TDB6_9ACTN|nr:hypothetical protein [Candidatus Microthrix subdominans]
MFRTDPGTKLAAAVLGTGVAYEVDHVDAEGGVAWSVVVKTKPAKVPHGRRSDPRRGSAPVPVGDRGKHRYVAITADEISDRRFHVLEPE